VVVYAWFDVPLTPKNRIWVAGIAVGTYFLVRKMATQILMEYMRRDQSRRS
jgi:hypothetical protein